MKKRLVFTNHTPEPGGNEKTNLSLLEKSGFFCDISLEEVKRITHTDNDVLDHTITAIRLSGIANGVSKLHHQTLCKMWEDFEGTCKLIAITNAQSFSYWSDAEMYKALTNNDDDALLKRKKKCKQLLFEEVADQNGEIYDENILTIVFA